MSGRRSNWTVGAVALSAVVTDGAPDMVGGRAIPTVDVTLSSTCGDCGQEERRASANMWRDSWEMVSSSPSFAGTGWGAWARKHPEACPNRRREVARYLTVGQAVVTVTNHGEAHCAGCGEDKASGTERAGRSWAQGHAERCRAMPKPGGAR